MKHPKKALVAGIVILAVVSAALIQQVAAPLGSSFGSSVVLAQGNTCPSIVKTALAATNKQCTRTGRNKACYGNNSASAEPQTGITNLKFSNPGDIADLQAIRLLRLSGMDTAANQWGIVLMRLQADLPDTIPQDNVTLLLFGNVELTDASQQATAARPTEIAQLLTAQASITPSVMPTLSATLAKSPTVTLTPTTIPDLSQPYTYKPMQAFYFKSGTSDTPCTEAPPDGILIQTPHGKQKVELSIDGAQVQLGSTVFLTAQPSGEMIIKTIEGSATMQAGGMQVTIPAGMESGVELDDKLNAKGVPGVPEPYGMSDVKALPILDLPSVVPIAAPLVPHEGTMSFACSFTGNTPSNITLTNNRDRAVSIYWVDFGCKEVFFKTLQPGQSYTQFTYVSRAWNIRDAENQTLLKQFVADGQLSAVSVP